MSSTDAPLPHHPIANTAQAAAGNGPEGTHGDRWLAAAWPLVRPHLPPAPGRVVEIGCGPEGGFVPALVAGGYDAVGIDPEAPDGATYRRTTFEEAALDGPVDAVVACTSLHHVGDLALVLDRVAAAVRPGGTFVVLEWGWDLVDDAVARWCFERLPPPSEAVHHSWLRRHHDAWAGSGRAWTEYLRDWAITEGLHPSTEMLDELDARFTRVLLADMPYFFCELADTTATDEQAAIDAGRIRASGLRYVGRRP
jgi:SAM-dependent methyltransferase